MDCDVDATRSGADELEIPVILRKRVLRPPSTTPEPWPNGDYDIDIKDLQFVNGRFGSTCAYPILEQPEPVAGDGVGVP